MIRIIEKKEGFIKVDTRDGVIEIFYADDRTCVSYTNLEGHMRYQFTLKNGKQLFMDGI